MIGLTIQQISIKIFLVYQTFRLFGNETFRVRMKPVSDTDYSISC